MLRYPTYLFCLFIGIAIGLFYGFTVSQTNSGSSLQDPDNLKAQAWEAWKKGEFDQAEGLATTLIENKNEASAGHHILFLRAFITGDYEGALRLYKKIDPGYSCYEKLNKTVVHAFLHLGRYEEAEMFASSRDMDKYLCDRLKILNENPLEVRLDKLTVVPFAEGPLSEYFPGFEVEIEGKKVVANVDTGGTFLHMAPARAVSLGIELSPGGEASHGTRRAEIYYGIAQSFRIGEAVLENVPVAALSTLVGQEDFIIFGTNILQRFLSTLDYVNKRLILSPLDDPHLREEHLAMLPEDRVEVPFYVGLDHYMFARGGVGEHKDLNFFIDSGLVSLHPGKEGGIRQAAFAAPASNLAQWGFKPEDIEKGVFESHLPLSLGPLEQKEHLFVTWKEESMKPFEKVRIDGLLSHAFLKNYQWTLDFSKRTFLFSRHRLE